MTIRMMICCVRDNIFRYFFAVKKGKLEEGNKKMKWKKGKKKVLFLIQKNKNGKRDNFLGKYA